MTVDAARVHAQAVLRANGLLNFTVRHVTGRKDRTEVGIRLYTNLLTCGPLISAVAELQHDRLVSLHVVLE